MSKNVAVSKGIDIAAILTLLTLSMYALGFLKQAALYNAIGCLWAIKFNSAQDFILQGALEVSTAFICAMIFGWRRDPDESLDKSMNIIGVVGAIWAILSIFVFDKFAVGKLMLAIMIELFPYATLGPVFYAFLFAYSNYGFQRRAASYLSGCIFVVVLSLYLYQEQKTSEIILGIGSTYMLAKSSGEQKSLLIGSINGKYLARPCGKNSGYSIIDSGAEWVVTPIKSASDCK